MERKFNVGDRVRILASSKPERVGVVTTVVSPLRPAWNHRVYPDGTMVHEVDLSADLGVTDKYATYTPDRLEPYYDGNERVAWSSCVWQPKQVRA